MDVQREVEERINDWIAQFGEEIGHASGDNSPRFSDEKERLREHLKAFVDQSWLTVSCTSIGAIDRAIVDIEKVVSTSKLGVCLPEKCIAALASIDDKRQGSRSKSGSRSLDQLIIPRRNLADEDTVLLLHNLGEVLWFKNIPGELSKSVILDPKLVIEFIRQVVNHELIDPNDEGKFEFVRDGLYSIRSEGKVLQTVLEKLPLWRDIEPELFVSLKKLLHEFQLAYPDPHEEMRIDSDMIVPIFWQLDGFIDPTPLSKEQAFDLLKPEKIDSYPAHLCWEYAFADAIPPTLFVHLAVESHAPGVKRNVKDGCIDAQDENAQVFISRISIPMDKYLGIRGRVVRIDVIAFDERQAWIKMKFFVCAMERVLEKFPGASVSRYVAHLPLEPCNDPITKTHTKTCRCKWSDVDGDVFKVKAKKELDGTRTYDESMLPWITLGTVGVEWLVHKQWRPTPLEDATNRLQDTMDRVELLMRASLRLSLVPKATRQYPGLWTLELFQPEQGSRVLRLWFHSDLTGICHHKHRPIVISEYEEFLAKYGVMLEAGLTIVSNLIPAHLDLGVLNKVVGYAKEVLKARTEHAKKIHSLIQDFNFLEQTGDRTVLTMATQVPEQHGAVSATVGLEAHKAAELLSELLEAREPSITADEIPEVSCLSPAMISANKNEWVVWASEEELKAHGAILLKYTGNPTHVQPIAPHHVAANPEHENSQPSRRLTVRIQVVSVCSELKKEWKTNHVLRVAVVSISGSNPRRERRQGPATDQDARPDWSDYRLELGGFSSLDDTKLEVTIKEQNTIFAKYVLRASLLERSD
ncbi:hypothetical protein PINS_up004310 [Pythium insidiosum]|nr:hypothetical protein PINS_up004310 [Pythium insidiosum]